MTNHRNRPAYLDTSKVARMKRDDLLAIYLGWLAFRTGQTKLADEFVANRKNTKAVLVDLIIAEQVADSKRVKADEPEAETLDGGSVEVMPPGTTAARLSKSDQDTAAIASMSRQDELNPAPAVAPFRPKSAPRSRTGVLHERMAVLYRIRPEFLPSFMRPVGVCGGGRL